jgi:hypothetical protein
MYPEPFFPCVFSAVFVLWLILQECIDARRAHAGVALLYGRSALAFVSLVSRQILLIFAPTRWICDQGFAILQAAALYTQAGDYQKTARFYYKKAEDTYYQANNWASYDDWRRARDQWDYFYSRNR